MQNYYRFHDNDQPLKEDFDKTRLSVIMYFLTKLETQWFINELKNCRLEPHELFGASNAFPSMKDVVLPYNDFPCSDENIYNDPCNVKSPFLCFRDDDTTNEVGSPCTSKFLSLYLCPDHGEDVSMQDAYPLAHVEPLWRIMHI